MAKKPKQRTEFQEAVHAQNLATFLREVVSAFGGVELTEPLVYGVYVSYTSPTIGHKVVLSLEAAETIVEQLKALSGPLCRRPSPESAVPPRRKKRGGILS